MKNKFNLKKWLEDNFEPTKFNFNLEEFDEETDSYTLTFDYEVYEWEIKYCYCYNIIGALYLKIKLNNDFQTNEDLIDKLTNELNQQDITDEKMMKILKELKWI